ncbi:MAG: ABC-F family ATP-binding cassette domain-containing protein [Candidatus Sericytochromatia bacterium]|nr:ABC-F family ATP-binding cassette domain-containing protein [Candidatus Sericytochromatia bacterium]
MCLRVTQLAKSYPTKVILDDVDWHVAPGQRWGLVGPNGAGKSTLFKIILGEIDADSGTVALRPRLTIGHLAQELLGDQGRTLQAEMWQAFPRLLELKGELATLETAMAEAGPAALDALVNQHADLHAEWERLEGWQADAKIGRVLHGLGFSEPDRERPLHEFSGGWQMRAALAKLLLIQPELLMLDEPTNHLDLEAIGWLEGYLAGYPGALVLISHDRHFLDAVVDHVAELEGGRLETYTGNYTRHREQRKARRAAQQAAFDRQQGEIEKMQAWIDRFRAKATKASAVKSREKALDRLTRVEAPPEEAGSIRFRFTRAPEPGRMVLTLTEISKDYGPGPLFTIERLELERGMRLALVGPNGAGKSTLMKLMAGTEKPTTGELAFGLRVLPGYFSQNQADSLDPENTVLEEAWAVDETVPIARLRTLLGCFLFRGEDVFKPIRKLSGGERSRLALAKLLLEPRNLLMLDEPTNHLDLGAKEELAEALAAFDGTAVIISHDRWFLENVATHVLHIEDGRADWYTGGYAYYREKHEEARLQARAAEQARVAEVAPPPVTPATAASVRPPKLSYKQAKAISEAESLVETLETRLKGLEAALVAPEVYQDGLKAAAVQADYEQVKRDLDTATENWLTLVDG